MKTKLNNENEFAMYIAIKYSVRIQRSFQSLDILTGDILFKWVFFYKFGFCVNKTFFIVFVQWLKFFGKTSNFDFKKFFLCTQKFDIIYNLLYLVLYLTFITFE